ncbi:MAG TPA: hypothetical protein VK955_06570 [Xanthobacteraceae bacterium]|nr:hypothetical protein [Xanthobacteraceae bacterium]
MAVSIGDHGGVLLHCFAGCEADAVAHALGLDMADLFPDRGTWGPPLARRWHRLTKAQAWDIARDDIHFATVAICNAANGLTPTDADRAGLLQAAARLLALDAETQA